MPSLAWVPEPRSFLPFSFKTVLPSANQAAGQGPGAGAGGGVVSNSGRTASLAASFPLSTSQGSSGEGGEEGKSGELKLTRLAGLEALFRSLNKAMLNEEGREDMSYSSRFNYSNA